MLQCGVPGDLLRIFSTDFWVHEAIALRDICLDLIGLAILYAVVRFVLNRFAFRMAASLISRQADRLPEGREARLRTLVGLIRSVTNYLLFFVFAILFLSALHFNVISVAAGASFAGLAVGFGAQKLVKDVISGFFIILENQYDVGDYVTINGVTGRVEEIGMRIMKIRDDTGKLFILSNGDISQVCNQSRGAVEGVVEIGVAPGSDIKKSMEIIDEAGKALLADRPDLGLSGAPEAQGIGSADATHTILRVMVRVSDPAKLSGAQIALRGQIHMRLTEAGITIA